MPEIKKPNAQIITMIVTDGQENASREWTRDSLKARIKECEAAGYSFLYLGANVDSFAEAGQIGIPGATTMNYANNAAGTQGMYSSASANVTGSRTAYAGGQSVQDSATHLGFADDQRSASMGNKPVAPIAQPKPRKPHKQKVATPA